MNNKEPTGIKFKNGCTIKRGQRSKMMMCDEFCGMSMKENIINDIIEKLKREINELSSKHKAIICDENKSDEQIMADLISILNEGIESIKHNQLPQSIPILDYDLMVGGIDEV